MKRRELTEVAAAEVDACVHVARQLRGDVVVQANVCIEKVFNRANVVAVGSPSVTELLRAEVYTKSPCAAISSKFGAMMPP